MHVVRSILAGLCLFLVFPVSSARSAEPALGLHLAPCTQGRSKSPAMCGTFGVYENRATYTGRVIPLGVIVLKAKHPTHRAIAFIAGGPGESTTPFAAAIADGEFEPELAYLRNDYDIVFADDRGMGQSHPFDCEFAPPDDPASYFRQLWPDRVVSACRAKSAVTHDLRQYNTDNSVDDLDELRAALGYPKLVLEGGSYGTTFSLVFMRRHAQNVESAVLISVAPPGFLPLPGAPDGAQTALDDLIAQCRHDSTCHRDFPNFAQRFKAVLQRFNTGMLPVPVNKQTVALSKEVFVDQLRHVLYSPYFAAYVPYIIERAYRRDYAPLGQMIQSTSQAFSNGLNAAANLSYTCADWMPFLDPNQLHWAVRHSFAGDLRIRAQQHACAIWNVPAMPATFNEPVHSDIPVLMVLSSNDPGTPARYGEEALRYLPNGRAVVLKGGGHSVFTACSDKLILQFVRAGSAKGLDVSQCRNADKAPPFATSMKGWPS
jgi:pimeloyl-ACP methyl ester carboxylesterase